MYATPLHGLTHVVDIATHRKGITYKNEAGRKAELAKLLKRAGEDRADAREVHWNRMATLQSGKTCRHCQSRIVRSP